MNLQKFMEKTAALRSSLRFKLITGLLTIVFLMGALSIFIGINSINRNVIREAYDNLRNSLKAINDLYQEEINTRSKLWNICPEPQK